MGDREQADIFSDLNDLDFVRMLLADVHDNLRGSVARFRQLHDLSHALGSGGAMITGGEIAYAAWREARSSFIHGNFVATVLLSQSLAEQMLASFLTIGLDAEPLPPRIGFRDTLNRCVTRGVISKGDAEDFEKLMNLRNPLSHHRLIDDPTNLSRRVADERLSGEEHLRRDATFAIAMAIRLLAMPVFRLEG